MPNIRNSARIRSLLLISHASKSHSMGLYENAQALLTAYRKPIAVLAAIGVAKLAFDAVRDTRRAAQEEHKQYTMSNNVIEFKPALSHGYREGPADPAYDTLMEQEREHVRDSGLERRIGAALPTCPPDVPLSTGKPKLWDRIRGRTYVGSGLLSNAR